jgi:Fe2+ transport system protein B
VETDESVDEMMAQMARIDRMRAYLEKTFGGPVVLTVGWNGESWDELRKKDFHRRVREAVEEIRAQEKLWKEKQQALASDQAARTKGSRSTAQGNATASTGRRSPGARRK